MIRRLKGGRSKGASRGRLRRVERASSGPLPHEASAAAGESSEDSSSSQGIQVQFHVIEDMHAPVPHFSRPGIPVPVPVVLELVPIQRLILCGTEPQVVVDVVRNLQRRFPLADRRANAVPVHTATLDRSQCLLFVQELFDFGLHRRRALLRAELANPLIFAGGVDGLNSFPLRMR